jgi:hypothetical protein
VNRLEGCSILFMLLLIVTTAPTLQYVTIEGQPQNHYSLTQSDAENITEFSDNVLLSAADSPYANHVEPTIAITDNGTLFAGYKNAETPTGGGARVSIVKSVDGGKTWTEPYNMPHYNTLNTRQSDPWLVWHDGVLYYSYLEYSITDTSFTQVTVANSEDYGSSWHVTKASNNTYFADKETMTIAEDGTVYMVYDDADTSSLEGNVTIRLSRSIDGGESFQEISTIGWPDPGNLGPYITLNSEGHLFVAWSWVNSTYLGNLYIAKSTDKGVTFDPPRLINTDGNYTAFTSAGGAPAKATLPVIRFDQTGRLYVLWADTYDPDAHSFDIYLRVSLDEGATWTQRYQVNPQTVGDQWQPDMDIDSSNRLHIVYYDEVFNEYQPYYLTATMTGDEGDQPEFSSPIAIASEPTSSSFTRPGDYFTVRLDQKGVPQVVWTDGRNDEMDIYYAHGIGPGETTIPGGIDILQAVLIVVVLIAVVSIVILIYRRKA